MPKFAAIQDKALLELQRVALQQARSVAEPAVEPAAGPAADAATEPATEPATGMTNGKTVQVSTASLARGMEEEMGI